MRIALDIALRLAALLAIEVLFLKVIVVPGDDDGLATGLTAFAAFVGVAFLWGMLDGFLRDYGHLVVVWVASGCLFGIGAVLLSAALSGQIIWSEVLDDLRSTTPFLAGLVAVPAVLAGALGAVVRPASSRA